MKVQYLFLAAAAAAVQGIRIVQSNDDGWAELYLRSFHYALKAAGHNVVLSAPAENKSGSGSRDHEPSPRTSECQYGSCPADTGQPVGRNESSPRLNWVNSDPVTSMRYGIEQFGPQEWNNAAPELAVAGPNVGTNVFVQVPYSGTVGAAAYAAHRRGIPAIAFSGASEGPLAWDTDPVPLRSLVYAQLATQFVGKIVEGGKPYLPSGVWLNVNFPKIEGSCTDASKFKWVLSRIDAFTDWDIQLCGVTWLPMETDVLSHVEGGCYITVSVGNAGDKMTAPKDMQEVVLAKLKGLFSCLPIGHARTSLPYVGV
ncbi:survival protein sure-likephosphatase/nucleotidase-like protein [Apodospora peruviana]|uniref:Survival protein sure-likephosphatase/nucleotidase-like protein n=1 Tax=Apodospora peruviana TaxID=516989 RepID=A0AAE0HWT3_9PEZI|nr:survival protein sure-likephosphatase/nucleotidase-like protein [Apodospora peruviana]